MPGRNFSKSTNLFDRHSMSPGLVIFMGITVMFESTSRLNDSRAEV